MRQVLAIFAILLGGLLFAGCSLFQSGGSTPAAVANALQKADQGVAVAAGYFKQVCDYRNLIFAVGQTALHVSGASEAAWADERKAEAELIALCEQPPSSLAEAMASAVKLKARIEGLAGS